MNTPYGSNVFAFQPAATGRGPAQASPEPDRGGRDALPEREWGLSALQVAGVVVVIVVICEVAGLLF